MNDHLLFVKSVRNAVFSCYVIFSVSSSFFAMDTRCTLSDGKIIIIYREPSKVCHGCVPYRTYRGIPPVLPVPDTLVSSVRHQYRDTGHFGNFGTTSISRYLRHRYGRLHRSWYRHQYSIDTATDYFGKFGTTSTRYSLIVTPK